MAIKVKVIALEPGFFNATYRKVGEEFYVEPGQELGVHWFRPVVVGSIPQGEVDVPAPERKNFVAEPTQASIADLHPEAAEAVKRIRKRKTAGDDAIEDLG